MNVSFSLDVLFSLQSLLFFFETNLYYLKEAPLKDLFHTTLFCVRNVSDWMEHYMLKYRKMVTGCYQTRDINIVFCFRYFSTTFLQFQVWTKCSYFKYKYPIQFAILKVVSTTFLLFCFVSLKKSFCETRKKNFFLLCKLFSF